MVASISNWDERTKLVNLTTRLRGQAYAFYKSCSVQQRGNYTTLVAELTKRFTPVRLKAVQSGLFHERKQKVPSESVDTYAQGLRRLFYLAYPQAQQGTQDAEDMGRSVLCCQFVTGLRQEIKLKLAGVEGTFDQLLARARLEEAKLRDLADHMPKAFPKKPSFPLKGAGVERSRTSNASEQPRKTGLRCFNCHGTGHFAKNCPLRGQVAPEESRGRSAVRNTQQKSATMKNIVVNSEQEEKAEAKNKHERVMELRHALQEAELEESLSQVAATMHVLTGKDRDGLSLGPTPTVEMSFEGVPTRALLDTGSPVTIVSLSFVL